MKKDILDVIKELNKIRIKAKIESASAVAGAYHSTFKGQGIHFAEIREYVFGDDFRNIDWNTTARLNAPFVKLFEEEREQTFVVCVDISSSLAWGTKNMEKRVMATYLAGYLLFTALSNNDRISALLFSSKSEIFVPPGKGINHFMNILRNVYLEQPSEKSTSIVKGLQDLFNALKKKSFILLISDFLDKSLLDNFENSLKVFSIVSKKHYLRVIYLCDPVEYFPPTSGFFWIRDVETGEEKLVDFSSKSNRKIYQENMKAHINKVLELLTKAGVKYAIQYTNQPFLKSILKVVN